MEVTFYSAASILTMSKNWRGKVEKQTVIIYSQLPVTFNHTDVTVIDNDFYKGRSAPEV